MDAAQIVHTYTKNRMSATPSYYAGRGVTTSDLNSELLMNIYEGVKKEKGKLAAAEFVKMVDQQELSATGFLNALFALEGNNWACPNLKGKKPVDDIAEAVQRDSKSLTSDQMLATSLGIFGSLLGRNQDDTQAQAMSSSIRRGFYDLLKSKGEKLPAGLNSKPDCSYGFPYHTYWKRQ